jgi:pyridoxal phosphate enzyme (YggS family)
VQSESSESEVAEHYRELVERVRAKALQCGRDPKSVRVVAVSKTYPLEHVMPAYEIGCRDFGESRVQELQEKAPVAPKDILWHFIGPLQRNKVGKIVGECALIHSVDSQKLAESISSRSLQEDSVSQVLIQVNTSGESTKHGFSVEECEGAWEQLLGLKGIQVRGLMTIAPYTKNQDRVRTAFSELRELRDRLERCGGMALPDLSMGMSQDYEIAIEEGATLLRVGSALFGKRA